MLSVLVGIGNNHENKQGVVYEAHWYMGRRGPHFPEKSSFSQSPALEARLLDGDAFSREGNERGQGEEVDLLLCML